ncbi:ATP-binding protein [Azospirillum palustre]|nr:ATP-binding protein [Azospirillum palustre]
MAPIPRHLIPKVERALTSSRVVNVIGPRQAGKTTLVRDLIDSAVYVTLDADDLRSSLDSDPYGQLQLLSREGAARQLPIVIDEVQRLPDVTLALKRIVDTESRPGQFLLTGSADIFTIGRALDSLAGRVMTLTLRPLSGAEIQMRTPAAILDAVAKAPDDCLQHLPAPAAYSREAAIDLMLRGGFPEIRRLDTPDRMDRYQSYLDSVVEKDVAVVAPIRKPDVLRRLIDQLANRTANELNIASLCSALGDVRKETVNDYIDILRRLGIVHLLGAWTSAATKREVKRPKIHFMDTGIATALRGEDGDSFGLLANPTALGQVLETFVYTEVEKSLPLQSKRWTLHHYRDDKQREVDLIAQAPNRVLALFEMKASATVTNGDFRHADWFFGPGGPAEAYKGCSFVVYLGDRLLPFGPRKIALPLSMFWSF